MAAPPQKILIIGAGIAGPALVTWLARLPARPHITLVERAPGLRSHGQQIDLRGQGITVMRKMGLEQAVRAIAVDERGMELVDPTGARRAFLGRSGPSSSHQSFSAEFEIMRGDLCKLLFDEAVRAMGGATEEAKDGDKAAAAAKGYGKEDKHMRVIWGTSVVALREAGDAVKAEFSDGRIEAFDLVVGADGQGSRTRRLMLGEDEGRRAFVSRGMWIAYYSAPPEPAVDGDVARACHLPGGRAVLTRAGRHDRTGIYLAACPRPGDGAEARLRGGAAQSEGGQRALLADLFADAAWQRGRVLGALRAADDFYFQQMGQVRAPAWRRGRVVLLGDAGYCPSPLSGFGTSLALVGAYVLAGELARRGADVDAALAGYEATLRPFVDKVQDLPPGLPGLWFPQKQWGIRILQLVVWLISVLRIDRFVGLFGADDDRGWKLPEYPEIEGGIGAVSGARKGLTT